MKGCGNSDCKIEKPKGVSPVGRCRCKHKVSIEKLSHYQCKYCEKWWSIGDAPENRAWFCPWCGIRLEAEEKEIPIQYCTYEQWLPIETAPKDGTIILASGKNDGDEKKGRHIVVTLWKTVLGGTSEEKQGWGDDCDGICGEFMYLTHWMPLPIFPNFSIVHSGNCATAD
jgi:hypothetical protein